MLFACAALTGLGDLERSATEASDAAIDVSAVDASAIDADAAIAPDSSLSDVLVDAGTTARVTCGTADCPLASSFCCAVSDGGGSCLPTGTACADVPVTCDDPSDCPAGRVCCGVKLPASSDYANVNCAASCAFDGTDNAPHFFCSLDAGNDAGDDAGNPGNDGCPLGFPGVSCLTSSALPPYTVCR